MKKAAPLAGLPIAGRLAGLIDLAVRPLLFGPKKKNPRTPNPDRRAELLRAIAFYKNLDDAAFFPAPPVPRMLAQETVGSLHGDGGRAVDVKWASGYQPAFADVAERWLKVEANRFGYARLFLHDQPRPALICFHGYRGGGFQRVEEWAFGARKFFAAGFDVALVTLPHHGKRHSDDAPRWPSRSLGWVNEGFGQAVWDARSLQAWMARRSGVTLPPLAMGMSLGGYVAASWATVEPLTFVAPVIPLGAFSELIWNEQHTEAERADAARQGITLDELTAAMRIHAPLLRAPKISPARVHVIGAAGDAIVPIVHAERLAAHFGCALTRLLGGHLLQVGRDDAYEALAGQMKTAVGPI